MKTPSKLTVILATVAVLVAGTGAVVALQADPEQPRAKTVATVRTDSESTTEVEQQPLEVAQPNEANQQVVTNDEPTEPALTPEENKMWFVAEAKTNIRASLTSRNLIEKADQHPHFWYWQELCVVQAQEKRGGFADRATLEQAAEEYKAIYFENVSCKVFRFND